MKAFIFVLALTGCDSCCVEGKPCGPSPRPPALRQTEPMDIPPRLLPGGRHLPMQGPGPFGGGW